MIVILLNLAGIIYNTLINNARGRIYDGIAGGFHPPPIKHFKLLF